MPRPFPRRLLAAALFLSVASAAPADEVTDKQKSVAVANLKKAGITGTAAAETPSLFVHGTMPEAKVKALAAGLQKVHDAGRKALEYGPDEQPWKGKLTVYAVNDRRQYRLLVLNVEMRRVESGESASYALKTDEPHVIIGSELPDKSTDADLLLEAGPVVAAALMMRKGGAIEYPEWLKNGFGRAVTLKSDGNAKRLADYKAKARPLVLGGPGRAPATVADATAGGKGPGELLATSLAEYMAYGPGKANFSKFLGGFRPNENQAAPTVDQALEAAGWKADALEKDWAKWVRSGK